MKKKIIILMLIIASLIIVGLIAFVFLNKCKKEECKPCNTPTEIVSTDQEKALEKMIVNNEISELKNEQTDKYEQVITKSSCKIVNNDDKGRYLMRCEINVTTTAIDNGEKHQLTDMGYYFGYTETLTGGKYRMLGSWYSDSLKEILCWNFEKEKGLNCDKDGTE